MLTPGSAMDMEGWIRIGYANDPEILSQGLHKISEFQASKAKATVSIDQSLERA